MYFVFFFLFMSNYFVIFFIFAHSHRRAMVINSPKKNFIDSVFQINRQEQTCLQRNGLNRLWSNKDV